MTVLRFRSRRYLVRLPPGLPEQRDAAAVPDAVGQGKGWVVAPARGGAGRTADGRWCTWRPGWSIRRRPRRRAGCTHLVDLARLPNLTIRILPFASGAHPAMAGTFSILSFPARYDDDVVYIETLTSNLWVEDERDVRCYTRVLDHLRAIAYEVDESISFIATVAEQI